MKTLGPCPEGRMPHWGLEQSRVVLPLMFMRASQATVRRTSDGAVENGADLRRGGQSRDII